MTDHSAALLDVDGPFAPPRRNGELAFEAPWESRLFGLTMTLHRAGVFEWEEFRERLIAQIRHRESDPDEPWSYYACWSGAFEDLLASKGLCTTRDIENRCLQFAARPAGHDH